MARIQNLNVAGMSIEDIRQLDTRTLSDRALKQALNRLVSASNKRLRRLSADEYGRNSPTVQRTRTFSAKGAKTRGEIKAEFERARAFLDPSKKSHTVRGWRKTVQKMEQRGIPKEFLKDPAFYALYRRFEKDFVPGTYDSDTLFTMIASLYTKYEDNEIYEILKDTGTKAYETGEDEEGPFTEYTDELSDYYE